jgi:predicted transcriptional regulator YdeE
MEHQVIPSFYVAGHSVRTNNHKISEAWGAFMQNNPAHLLPKKLGDEIYAVYTDYESDQNGDYTLLIGYKVESTANLPAEVTALEVPSGNYAVFTSDQGPLTEIVPALWKTIWSLTPEQLNGTRSFKTDFELYGLAKVDIFLGLKP